MTNRDPHPLDAFLDALADRLADRAGCTRPAESDFGCDFGVRAGVSQRVAMELTGHLRPSVFDRYNITDDRDRRDAVAKLAPAAQDKQVLSLKRTAAQK